MERVKAKAKAKYEVDLLLDSGAYGAWARSEALDVKDYIRFCKALGDHAWQIVNLDVIPGAFLRRANTADEVEHSAAASYKNLQRMKDAGLNPMPVFHMGERLHWLEKLLKDGETYIGLSLNKTLRPEDHRRYLDMVFNMLTDREGRPYVRTHGFAVTSYPMMVNYPWASVDSTTWSLTPGYGQIIVPPYIDGEFNYLREPMRVAVSGVRHQSVSSQKKQFENLGDVGKRHVERFLEEAVGTTISRARYSTQDRRRCLLVYYLALCKALKDVRYVGARARITGPDHFDTSTLKARDPFNLRIVYATTINREWATLMNELGARSRLLSYWEMRKRPVELIQQWVATGNTGVYKQAPIRQDWNSETYLNRRRLALLARIKEYNDQSPDDAIELEPKDEAEAIEAATGVRS